MSKTYFMLVHAHSGLRWIVLLLLVAAVFNALSKLKSSTYTNGDRKLNLFAMVFYHVQFLLGWIMYFVSVKVQFFQGWMKESMYRFYGIEHALMMTLAFILLTVGHSKSKKAEGKQKHKKIAIFYTLALLLILAAIPWPFRTALAASWF